jgi:hypothetical protein
MRTTAKSLHQCSLLCRVFNASTFGYSRIPSEANSFRPAARGPLAHGQAMYAQRPL